VGVILTKKPNLEKPDLIACWPGIGNIGIIAVNTLRGQVDANELGEIESWDFFYPKKAIVTSGVLEDLDFPFNKFYYKVLQKKDLLFFVGEEQPTEGERVYAEGRKAYRMANLVLDVAEQFGCRRVYTSGAAVSFTHHELEPRVWVVTSKESLTREIKAFDNTILMSDIEGKSERGSITGLNGLLLGLAKKRGFDAVCLMGEIPDYLSGVPFPYPKASKSVLELFGKILGIDIDYSPLDQMSNQVDEIIEGIYEKLPFEIKEKIEQRRMLSIPKKEIITEEDEKWLKEHLDELFKRSKGDDKLS
jgi:proteasome assembly chaperone (PAC2) family protein